MFGASRRLIAFSSKIDKKTLSTRITFKVTCFFNQQSNFHSYRLQQQRLKNFSNCFNKIGSLRTIGSYSNDSYRRFRTFRNGDQLTKRFADSVLQYTVSVAFSPKDRLKDDSISNDEGGEFVQNYKDMVNSTSVHESQTGEDNYILAYTEIGVIIGVLDGVGGWSEQGFDSSAISRELANNITKNYLLDSEMNPMEILKKSFKEVKESEIVKVGSTTICFGIIDAKSGKLDVLNLGDSWFGVFRKDSTGKYRCFYESLEQIHYFNAPYQLSIIPKDFLELAEKKGSKYLMNEPEEAVHYSSQLQSGDLVLFSTDGLIDNVFPEDIELYLNDNVDEEVNLSEKLGDLNKILVQQTTVLSLNTNFKSAFSQKLTKLTGQDYVGGKPDDITSVMVYVK